MSQSYKALVEQRKALDQQIKEARMRELTTAVEQVRALIREYDLTQDDIFPPARGTRVSAAAGSKVAPKYRNPATGDTWTGRGKPPKWIQNQDREQFLI